MHKKYNRLMAGIMLSAMLIGCGTEDGGSTSDVLQGIPLKSESDSGETAEAGELEGTDQTSGESLQGESSQASGENPQGESGQASGENPQGGSGQASGENPQGGSGQASGENSQGGSGQASGESQQDGTDRESTGNSSNGNTGASGQGQPTAGDKDKSGSFRFSDLGGWYFYFSSGAGGWATELRIAADGTLKGNYHDSEMGSQGEGFPNGTMYISSFTGKFDSLEKVDDHTYKMKLASLKYEQEPETEEIEDGIRYIYSAANGLYGGEEFYLYLPGAELTALPESYLQWVGYNNLESVSGTTLPYYGLYNVNTEEGFSSYQYEEKSLLERIEMEISFAEESDKELNAKLEEATSQGDMNAVSAELFQNWDDTLNIVWKLLEAELGEVEMAALREEERAWVAEKEEAVKAAGLEFEGGTVQPMMEAMKGAELTKERVYALAEYAGH